MADDQKAIVQRMIDAGESEENIATVIQHFKAQTPYQPVLTPGRTAPLETGAPPDPEWMSGLKGMLQPLSHPQTAGEMATLALTTPQIPALGNVGTAAKAVYNSLPSAKSMLSGTLRAAGAVMQNPYKATVGGAGRVLSRAGEALKPVAEAAAPAAEAAPAVEAAAPAASGSLSAEDKAALVKQGYTPDVIQRIEQANAPVTGSLRMDPVASHPLTQPRVDAGAEAVGRANGLTKQAVRDATGPIGGEAPGEASDFVPENAFNRMHDKILAMGPQATEERTAYANAAKDPKTRGQLMATVRTLSRNGLAAPLVAGGVPASEMLRQELLRRLSSDPTPQGPQ